MMKKVVLVTGASSGIGLSIANYLHFQKNILYMEHLEKVIIAQTFLLIYWSLMLQTNHLLKIVFLIF